MDLFKLLGFSPEAKELMLAAYREADALNHEQVGVEHFLRAMVRCANRGSRILSGLGVDLRALRQQIDKCYPSGLDMVTKGRLPYSREVDVLKKYAAEEALRLGQNTIGTEHLLLGMMFCEARQILNEFGVTHEKILEAVRALGESSSCADLGQECAFTSNCSYRNTFVSQVSPVYEV